MQASPLSPSIESGVESNVQQLDLAALGSTNDSEFVWHTLPQPEAEPNPAIRRRFSDEVLGGLCQESKTLPSAWIYDATGIELARRRDAIPEFYLTRTEADILRLNRPMLREVLCHAAGLIEIGNGVCATSPLLLDAMDRPTCYAPINISPDVLEHSARLVGSRFPEIACQLQHADYRQPMSLSAPIGEHGPLAAYCPGSSLASLAPLETVVCMQRIRQLIGPGGLLIVGQDTTRTPQIVLSAYADTTGANTALNRNILGRINRELAGSFDPDRFDHEARFNHRLGRVETHLVSRSSQWVEVSDRVVHFEMGESIHTGNAYKYAAEEFRALAQSAGWNSLHIWTDADERFAVHVLMAGAQTH